MSDMQRCIRAEEGGASTVIPSIAEAVERAIQASPCDCGGGEFPEIDGGGSDAALDVLPRRDEDEDDDWDEDDEDDEEDEDDLDEEDQEDWEYDWDEGEEDEEGEDEEGW